MTREEIVKYLLANPEKMLLKKPFYRGSNTITMSDRSDGESHETNTVLPAALPSVKKRIVTQERFARELDPECHDVIFDENIPSICVKKSDGEAYEIEFRKSGIAMQERIREKKTLAICGNEREFTLHDSQPSEQSKLNYQTYKWYWKESNQDGLGCKAVHTQLGYGDVGLLMYFNEKKQIRGRIFSYQDGYVVISHNDNNNERVMECLYYATEDGVEHIDAYDDTNMYSLVKTEIIREKPEESWRIVSTARHGFSEIPLITKRGDVAWNNVQPLIELYEIIYNIFAVVQKRNGWGILYIKGNIKNELKKIAGSIILQDTTPEGKGAAEFKAPPTPQGILDFLQSILDQIQIGAGVTFILPKDIKTGGDLSGVAMQMTRSFDIESARQLVIDWQNFANKHARLFKEGLAKQLVESGENPNAVTEFADMRITCKFKVWQPFDESAYNQMLCTLRGSGIISRKTAVEKNTIATPDELARIESEDAMNAQLNNTKEEILITEQ